MMTPNKNWDPKQKPPDPPVKPDKKCNVSESESLSDLNARKRLAIDSPEDKTPAKKREQCKKSSSACFAEELMKSEDETAVAKIQNGDHKKPTETKLEGRKARREVIRMGGEEREGESEEDEVRERQKGELKSSEKKTRAEKKKYKADSAKERKKDNQEIHNMRAKKEAEKNREKNAKSRSEEAENQSMSSSESMSEDNEKDKWVEQHQNQTEHSKRDQEAAEHPRDQRTTSKDSEGSQGKSNIHYITKEPAEKSSKMSENEESGEESRKEGENKMIKNKESGEETRKEEEEMKMSENEESEEETRKEDEIKAKNPSKGKIDLERVEKTRTEVLKDIIEKAVLKATKPLEDEIKKLKESNINLESKILNHIEQLKTQLETNPTQQKQNNAQWPSMQSQQFPALPQPHHKPNYEYMNSRRPETKEQTGHSNPAINLTSRVVGLHPVNEEDLEAIRRNLNHDHDKTNDLQIVGKMAARDYMSKILRVPDRTIDQLEIVKVFLPQAGLGARILYVEFAKKEELEEIRKYSPNLNQHPELNPSLVQYVPKSLENRYRAVMQIAYKQRNPEDPKIGKKETKIWFNQGDFQLRLREKNSKTPWAKIQKEELTNLPDQAPRVYFKQKQQEMRKKSGRKREEKRKNLPKNQKKSQQKTGKKNTGEGIGIRKQQRKPAIKLKTELKVKTEAVMKVSQQKIDGKN